MWVINWQFFITRLQPAYSMIVHHIRVLARGKNGGWWETENLCWTNAPLHVIQNASDGLLRNR